MKRVKLVAPAVRQQPSEASGCGGAPAGCLGVPPPGWLSEWKHRRGGSKEGGEGMGGDGGRDEGREG